MDKDEGDFEYILGLEKIETDAEDNLIVAGIATTETRDHDGEIVDMGSVREVWKDYMVNPVVRYFHGKDRRNPDAIGIVVPEHTDSNGKTWKTEMTDEGPFIVAKLSNAPDTESIRTKVKEGILKGFSIGGRAKRVKEYSHELGKDINRVITKRISEISIVDLPANPDSFFTVIKGCVGGQCNMNLEKVEDARPPKVWWDNCMSTAKSAEGIKDPEAFCSWMYHHGRGSGFAMQREAIGKSSNEIDNDFLKSANDLMLVEDEITGLAAENDDLQKQIDDLQSSTESKLESEEVVMKHTETNPNTGGKSMEQDGDIVRFGPEELKDFIKGTVEEDAKESEIIEKADDYDRLLTETKELRAKIEALEAQVTAQAKSLQNQPQTTMKNEGTDADADDTEKSESDAGTEGDVEKMAALEARLKTVEESPLYKAKQGDEEPMDDKKKSKKGHLANIVSESFGTGGK